MQKLNEAKLLEMAQQCRIITLQQLQAEGLITFVESGSLKEQFSDTALRYAYHEIGHSLIPLNTSRKEVNSISIDPSNGRGDSSRTASDWSEGRLQRGLAGAAAEQLKCGNATFGCGGDFNSASIFAIKSLLERDPEMLKINWAYLTRMFTFRSAHESLLIPENETEKSIIAKAANNMVLAYKDVLETLNQNRATLDRIALILAARAKPDQRGEMSGEEFYELLEAAPA